MGLRRLSGRKRSCDAASTFRSADTELISSLTPVRTGHAPCKMPLSRSVGKPLFDPLQEEILQKIDQWAQFLQRVPVNVPWHALRSGAGLPGLTDRAAGVYQQRHPAKPQAGQTGPMPDPALVERIAASSLSARVGVATAFTIPISAWRASEARPG